MNKLFSVLFFFCIACNSNSPKLIESILPDTCVNALLEYEDCNWGGECQRRIAENYPQSWEAAYFTFAVCDLGGTRCAGLMEGCEAL